MTPAQAVQAFLVADLVLRRRDPRMVSQSGSKVSWDVIADKRMPRDVIACGNTIGGIRLIDVEEPLAP